MRAVRNLHDVIDDFIDAGPKLKPHLEDLADSFGLDFAYDRNGEACLYCFNVSSAVHAVTTVESICIAGPSMPAI